MKIVTFLLLVACCALSAVEAEKLMQQRNELLTPATIQRIRQSDPLMAEWLQGQYRITDNLFVAIQKDAKRAESLKGDFSFLLTKYKQELDAWDEGYVFDRENAVNVKQTGAIGNGMESDREAILEAIQVACDGEFAPRSVFLPKGRYVLEEGITITDIKHLRIFGENGTELLIKNPLSRTFSIIGGEDVRLENLKITYVKRPFTTGVIKERVNDNTIRCQMDPGTINPLDPMFTKQDFKGLMRFYTKKLQPGSKRPLRSSVLPHQISPTVTKVSDNVYDFQLKDFLPLAKEYSAGIHFVYYARTYGEHAIACINTQRPRIINVQLNSGSSMAFCFLNTERPFLVNCKVEADPDTYVSTAADGIYLRGAELGGLVLNNTIRHVGDDFINIHSLFSPPYDGCNSSFTLKRSWTPQYLKEGSRVGIMPVSKGINEPIVEGIVTKLTEKGDFLEMTTDVDFGDCMTWTRCSEKHEAPKGDFLVLLDDLCHGLIIRGNTFENGLSRFLAGGRNWLFIGNRVVDSLQHPWFMNIGEEAGADLNAEVHLPRNIEISSNVFDVNNAKELFIFDGSMNQHIKKDSSVLGASHIKIYNNQIYVKDKVKLPDNMPKFFIDVKGNEIKGKL